MEKIFLLIATTLAASLILAPDALAQDGEVCYWNGSCFSEEYYESTEPTQSSHSEPTDKLAEVVVEGNEVTISQDGIAVVVPFNQFAAVVEGYVNTGNEDDLLTGAKNIAYDAGVPDQTSLVVDGLLEASYEVVMAEEKTDPMSGESLSDEELAEYTSEPTQAQEDTITQDSVGDESASLPITGGSMVIAGAAILAAMLFGGLLFRRFSR